MPSGITTTLASVFFTNANTGFAVGDSAILKTTDGGTNWIKVSGGNYILYSVFFPDPITGYAVGTDLNSGTIVKTTDGGANWNAYKIGTPECLMSVYFIDSVTGYTVGQYGTIMKTTHGGCPVGINDNKPVLQPLRLYPNPTCSTLIVKTVENGTLTVLNLGGMLFLKEEITKPSATIDVSNLPSGVYLLKVVGAKEVKVGKFIKE